VVLNATTMRAVGQVRRQGRLNGVASPSKLSLHILPELPSHVLAPIRYTTMGDECGAARVWWVHATQCGGRGWTGMVQQYKFRKLRVYFENIRTRTSDKFREMNVQFESTRA